MMIQRRRRQSYQSHSNETIKQQPMQYHHSYYTIAITRDIPNSFINALSTHHDNDNSTNIKSNNNNDDNFCLQTAKEQHDHYIQTLRSYIPNVIHLPANEQYPDSSFVEDTVVIVNYDKYNHHNDNNDSNNVSIAIITRPGHETRRNEVHDIKHTLLKQCNYMEGTIHHLLPTTTIQSDEEYMKVESNSNNNRHTKILYDMNHPLLLQQSKYDNATCDGGDVLYYPGNHVLFIGISNRTNMNGATLLRDIISLHQQQNDEEKLFEVIIVPPIVQGNNVLHIKSAITYLNSNTVVIPIGSIGTLLIENMKLITQFQYNIIQIPNVLTCNIVTINSNTIFVQDTTCTISRSILELAAKQYNLNIVYINTNELAKKDAALTCCSVLL